MSESSTAGCNSVMDLLPCKWVCGFGIQSQAGEPLGMGGVAWGINPDAKRMSGTQALIALKQSNGNMACNTYNVISKRPPLVPSPISFPATDLSSEFENGLMTIFAKVVLPSKKSVVNHVWEVGSKAEGLNPSVHAFGNSNLESFGSIDRKSVV